jgi:hypothetical protein
VAVARALVDTPLQVVYVGSQPSTEPSQLEIDLRLRGIRLIGQADVQALVAHGRPGPDGYVCRWLGEADGAPRQQITRFARGVAACLQQDAPVFAIVPPGVWAAVCEHLDLSTDAGIHHLAPSGDDASIARAVLQQVFCWGYDRRGALTSVRMIAQSAGLKGEGLLDLDWQPYIDIQAAPKRFPTPEVWQARLLPALLDVKQQVVGLPKQTALVVNNVLPLPAAIAVGYHLNVAIATLVAQGREAGASQRAAQFWYSDADAGALQPRYYEKTLTDAEPTSAVLELTTFTRIRSDIERFAEAYPVKVELWGVIERDAAAPGNMDEAEAVAYAECVARTVRELNGRGVSDIHLFVRAPSALGLLIGHRLRNCGRIHLYWYDNPTYRYAFKLA